MAPQCRDPHRAVGPLLGGVLTSGISWRWIFFVNGPIGRLIAHLPVRTGQAVAVVTRSAFTAGLNQILLVAAIIALASGLVSLAAIRGQDFAAQGPALPGA